MPDPEQPPSSAEANRTLEDKLHALNDQELDTLFAITQKLLGKQPTLIKRRQFLKLAGGGLAAAAVTGLAVGVGEAPAAPPTKPTSPDTSAVAAEAAQKTNWSGDEQVPGFASKTVKGVVTMQAEERDAAKEKAPRLSFLGIRNDLPKLMESAPLMGASRVRIEGRNWDPAHEPQLHQALEAAKRANLKILYLLNPTHSLPAAKIRQILTTLLYNYDVDLEIGNEPDNVGLEFWQNRDLKSFAQFVKMTIEEARKIKPTVQIVLGALEGVGNAPLLFKYLTEEGVSLQGVQIAIHAYNNIEDIEERVKAIKRQAPNSEIIFTELGAAGKNRQELPKLIEKALEYQPAAIYLHELPNPADQQMGLVDPLTGKPNVYFRQVQDWAQNRAKIKGKTIWK